MQLTTREAVEDALSHMAEWVKSEGDIFLDVKARTLSAMNLLCDHYGFKLSQFFDVEEA